MQHSRLRSSLRAQHKPLKAQRKKQTEWNPIQDGLFGALSKVRTIPAPYSHLHSPHFHAPAILPRQTLSPHQELINSKSQAKKFSGQVNALAGKYRDVQSFLLSRDLMVESLSLELAAAKQSLAKSQKENRDLERVLTEQNKMRREVMVLVNTCVQPCANRNRTSLYDPVSDSE